MIRTPLRTLAAEIGISKSAVDKFHKLRSNPGKLWPKLRDWYMRTRLNEQTDEYRTPPDLLVTCALTLLDQFPKERRALFLSGLVEHSKSCNAGSPTPDWLQMLADLADQERDT